MTAAVKCRACGTINNIGRMFCVRCGQQLSPGDIRPVARGGGPARFVRLLFLLALLAALVQMARPVPGIGRPGTTAEGLQCARRMGELEALTQAGRAGEERFTEQEVNGYLHHLLTNSPNRVTSGLVRAELETFRVRLGDGEAALVWVVRLGFLPLSYEVAGRPAIGPDGFSFEARRVRAGQLPLPGRAGAWAASRLFRVFANLTREKKLLDGLAEVRVEAEAVVARTGETR